MPFIHPNRRKTQCPQGHPYDEKNTKIGTKGERLCKVCTQANTKRWKRLHKGYSRTQSVKAFVHWLGLKGYRITDADDFSGCESSFTILKLYLEEKK